MNERADSAPADQGASDAPVPAANPDSDIAASPPPPRRARSWPAWLALLLALGAAGGAGYLWTLQQQQDAGFDEQAAAMADSRSQLKGLEQRVAEQAEEENQLRKQIDDLTERLTSQQRQLDELPLRLSRLERTVDELPGVAGASRAAWLIAEAEYYLRIGNAQLQLANNPDVALRALELADEKLRDLADPRLTPVRASLADEMTALRALPRPDVEGTVLAIGSLARSLDSLPLSRQAPERFGQAQPSAEAASGWARAWARIREALLGLVRIKQTDEAVAPLRTAAEESLLRQRLQSELELARLALMEGDAELYSSLLDDVQAALRRYFDTDAPAVRAAMNELAELSGIDLPAELPTISGSLELLQRVAGEAPAP